MWGRELIWPDLLLKEDRKVSALHQNPNSQPAKPTRPIRCQLPAAWGCSGPSQFCSCSAMSSKSCTKHFSLWSSMDHKWKMVDRKITGNRCLNNLKHVLLQSFARVCESPQSAKITRTHILYHFPLNKKIKNAWLRKNERSRLTKAEYLKRYSSPDLFWSLLKDMQDVKLDHLCKDQAEEKTWKKTPIPAPSKGCRP